MEIAVDQIRTISKKRIMKYMGKIDLDTILKLQSLITEMYGK